MLLLSDNGETLYVGARDAVLVLDVSNKDTVFLKSKVSRKSLPEQNCLVKKQIVVALFKTIQKD